MGLNDTQSSERVHIGFFGKRNAGKSSLVNAVTSQQMSVVSDVAGTTTDTVRKSMELLPIGPVVIMDTPGYDDCGMLGDKRIQVAKKTLNMTDIAILVVDAVAGCGETENELKEIFTEKDIPYITVYNKSDLLDVVPGSSDREIYVSAVEGTGIRGFKEMLGRVYESNVKDGVNYVADFVNKGDFVVLVVPIDSAAPKGRLIMPQQQAIREILDAGGQALVVKEDALAGVLAMEGIRPSLVITDSQVFELVSSVIPPDIPLTSFSILMARYKGFLDMAVKGAEMIDKLRDGDRVLISEGCTHHRQCGDIGTVKIPAWVDKYTGKKLDYSYSSGHDFPDDIEEYRLVIHCGGCMLGEKEMRYRMGCADDRNVAVTNYGTAIAYMKGILDRSTEIIYNSRD